MNPEQMRDASLLELFQMEARSQVQVLNTGLLALEKDPAGMHHIEACMRAAHSLKGAARIVDLEPAVRVAHAMEDCLMAAQQMRLRLGPADIDALLQGADLLQRAAQSDAASEEEIEAWSRRLQCSGEPAAAAAPATVAEPAVMPVLQRRQADRPDIQAQQGERVLRVTADTLNQLLGLSSQSLVESHWIALGATGCSACAASMRRPCADWSGPARRWRPGRPRRTCAGRWMRWRADCARYRTSWASAHRKWSTSVGVWGI